MAKVGKRCKTAFDSPRKSYGEAVDNGCLAFRKRHETPHLGSNIFQVDCFAVECGQDPLIVLDPIFHLQKAVVMH